MSELKLKNLPTFKEFVNEQYINESFKPFNDEDSMESAYGKDAIKRNNWEPIVKALDAKISDIYIVSTEDENGSEAFYKKVEKAFNSGDHENLDGENYEETFNKKSHIVQSAGIGGDTVYFYTKKSKI